MLEVNMLGILLATLAGMLLGAIWYSPLLFGSAWMKCIGKSPETLGSTTVPMLGSIIASLLTAIGIALLFSMIGPTDLRTALIAGVILGLLGEVLT